MTLTANSTLSLTQTKAVSDILSGSATNERPDITTTSSVFYTAPAYTSWSSGFTTFTNLQPAFTPQPYGNPGHGHGHGGGRSGKGEDEGRRPSRHGWGWR